MVQVKEVLRRWLRGQGERRAAEGAGVDRKTARRYIAAAIQAGVSRNGDESQLSDELVGQVCEAVRPVRPDGHGPSWHLLVANEALVKEHVEAGINAKKSHELLARQGIDVPYRTLARFVAERYGAAKQLTVPVDDPAPGQEVQVDFGRMGLLVAGERKRLCHALVFTACSSRHCFIWLTFSQTTEEVIRGFEAAWRYFGGIFPVVIPDNLTPVVINADPVAPRFNDTFIEYAQSRGFVIDAARVRHPKDKPRVERSVPYVRGSFWAGEHFVGLDDAQRRAERWCSEVAGMRVHRRTGLRPGEAFAATEAALLAPLPTAPYDIPIWARPKVHRDFHCEVARGLYSVPYTLIGKYLRARADSKTVKFYSDGHLVKCHVRVGAGKRSTDVSDFPPGKEIYATRDVDALRKKAAAAGPAIGEYATKLLAHPLPWTKMRQVYRLLGLAKKWGADKVDAACTKALEAEAVDVGLITRMVERAMEKEQVDNDVTASNIVAGRFSRSAAEFATKVAR